MAGVSLQTHALSYIVFEVAAVCLIQLAMPNLDSRAMLHSMVVMCGTCGPLELAALASVCSIREESRTHVGKAGLLIERSAQ